VIFIDQAGAMNWVTYNVPIETVAQYAPQGACVMISGVVENLGGAPILEFNWRGLPQPCE